jgi:hypothetical protein
MNKESASMTGRTKVPPTALVRVVERARHYVSRLHQGLAPAPVVMQELIFAAWMSQAIAAAAELGIADALAKSRWASMSSRTGLAQTQMP